MDYQNFEYFVESIVKIKKNDEFIYNNIDLKNSTIRGDYQVLVNDPQLYEFFLKKKKFFFSSKLTKKYISNAISNKNFYQNYFSYQYLKDLFKISELPYYLYHFFFNLKFNIKNISSKKKNLIAVYVNSLKHYNYLKFFLSSIKDKVIFITLSKKLLKELPKKEKLFFKHIELITPSFKFSEKGLSKEMYLYKVFKNFISINNIHLVIGIEGDCPVSEILYKAAGVKNIKSICVQWGAFPFVRPRLPFDNMSCNYFFSWGKFFENQLKVKNKNIKFISTGKKVSIKKVDKKNLITFIMSSPIRDFPEKYCNDLLKISEYIAKKYKNWNCVIRNHPLYEIDNKNKTNLKNFKFESFYKKPIDLCLKKSSIVVGLHTSVIMEAIYHDAIPVVYEANKKHKFYPLLDKKKIGFIRGDVKSIIKVIENLVTNKNKLIKVRTTIKNKKINYFSNINVDINPIIKNEIHKITEFF